MNLSSVQLNATNWQDLDIELVLTQDIFGTYHSFYWQSASNYGLKQEDLENQTIENLFYPLSKNIYQKKVKRVLDRKIPEKCHCLFICKDQILKLELIINPILSPHRSNKLVLVIGQILDKIENLTEIELNLLSHPESYENLLTTIVGKIRHHLTLENIWLQGVETLGQTLQVSRCLIMSYNPYLQQVDVKGEYCQNPFVSMLGLRLDISSQSYLQQAFNSSESIIVDQIQPDEFQQKSLLLVRTFENNITNGLIWLQQCDRYRQWTQEEIELVEQLAEQVGALIAQATLYQELEQATLKAEEASRLKSEFLASTTHELRTPLNGIIGFLKLILDGMADDEREQQEFLEQAYNSAVHLLNLINDILDIAKIEAGKLDIELSAIPLNDIFEEVTKFTFTQAKNKGLNFAIKSPLTYDHIMIYGNYQRVLQVMLNLVGNAIKFTNEGGIVIEAEVIAKPIMYHEQEFPGIVKISVSDTGIGVPLDKQDQLFQDFVQIDGSLTKTYSGTGLGLAISKKLVEAMGGKISFYSMGEELGSTVTFTIPISQLPIIKTFSSLNDSISSQEVKIEK